VTAYATADELATYTGAAAPADADRQLLRASELIDEVVGHSAAAAWANPLPDPITIAQAALRDAACAQVEFWSSFGEDHDVEGVRGSVRVGAVSIDRLPDDLAPRAYRALRNGGFLSALVGTSDGAAADTLAAIGP
jgi:hypothetical protein